LEEIVVDEINDITDLVNDVPTLRSQARTSKIVSAQNARTLGRTTYRRVCSGVLVPFPDGKTQHTSYPFGLHQEQIIPWNYHSIDDRFYLQARSCSKKSLEQDKETCRACEAITSTSIYRGIIDRIERGVHENTPLVYHGVGGLLTVVRRKIDQIREMRLMKLNTSRKLSGKVAVLEDHKQWILAIASGKVERVAALVQAGLAHRAGIRGLIQQYERAASNLYKPKGYTQEDMMRSIVLLRLGGARVAEFAHRSLSLPSITTIRRNTIIRPLVISPTTPTVAEVEANIVTCSEAFSSVSSNEFMAVMPLDSSRPEITYH